MQDSLTPYQFTHWSRSQTEPYPSPQDRADLGRQYTSPEVPEPQGKKTRRCIEYKENILLTERRCYEAMGGCWGQTFPNYLPYLIIKIY